jgi:RNA polymerase sigma factor (sigma-70 family)
MALDPANFETVYAAQADRLVAIGYRLTGDRSSAEDLVQEAFVRAFTSDAVIADPAAWLATVVRNGAIDRLRHDKRLVALAEETDELDADTAPALVTDDPAVDPEKATASSESVRIVWELVDELRPDQRTALILRYGEELPIGSVAAALGRTANATTVLLHRSRAALRARYADRVLARAGLPAECRAYRDDLLALVGSEVVSDAFAVHRVSCSWCADSEADLRAMTSAFAVAPMLIAPAALKGAVAAALAAHGVTLGTATSIGTAGAAATATGTAASTSAGSGLTLAGIGVSVKAGAVALATLGIIGGAVVLHPWAPGAPSPHVYVGTFESAGSLETVHSTHAAVALANGLVLVVGGGGGGMSDAFLVAEVFDPGTGTARVPAGPMTFSGNQQTAALLTDGTVLVAGGANPIIGSVGYGSSSRYDPVTDQFKGVASLPTGVFAVTMTSLPDGSAVVIGGCGFGGANLGTAERFRPSSNDYVSAGTALVARCHATATMLPDGRVLVIGGSGPDGKALASAESYK